MPQLFRRSNSKRDVSALGNGQPSAEDDRYIAASVRSNRSGLGESRGSSVLEVNDVTETANNGTNGADRTLGSARSSQRKPSLSNKAKAKFSTMFNNNRKDSSSRGDSTSDRRSRVSASPAPSDVSSIKENSDAVPSPRGTATKPPQARSSGYATPTKMKDVPSLRDLSLDDGGPETTASPTQNDPVDILPTLPPVLAASEVDSVRSTPVLAEEPKSVGLGSLDAPPLQAMPKRERSMSVYSQWSYDFDAADSDSDGEVYATPMDGLSEVEEEDEDDEHGKRYSVMRQPSARGLESLQDSRDVDASNSPIQGRPSPSRVESSHQVRRAPVESVITDVSKTPRARHGQVSTMTMEQQAECLDSDIVKCQEIIYLFLTSHMREAEAKALAADPDGSHMYIGNASCVIQAIKSMMTFDEEDLQAALEIAKITSALAHSLRKSSGGVTSRLAGLVRSGAQTAHIKSMNKVQKHAELVYAETLLIKAVLGIVAGGDWVGLIKEALNMRTAYGIYRGLQIYLEAFANDPELDEHFKSGVQLGTGLSSLMLSLLPSKVMKVAELFGYAGDRKLALETLQAAGGWKAGQSQPGVSAEQEGVRRAICDMALLTFHLVISALMPISGVDIPLAKNILDWNMKRYPDGNSSSYIPFACRPTQQDKACGILQDALDLKLEYLQWDMGVNNLVMCNFRKARSCFEILATESSWSKASAGEDVQDQANLDNMMAEVPRNLKKIAGKSLPIEKFVSRKARKFASQHHRLVLPGLELSYFFGTLPNAPPRLQFGTILPRIQFHLDALAQRTPETYNGGVGYWDDYCLAHFLRGVALSFAAYPHEETLITEEDEKAYPNGAQAAGEEALSSFKHLLEHAIDIHLDHWIIYFTHFEMGRLYSQMGDNESARYEFELVMSGKTLEVNTQARSQGKYSMESALMIRVHAGLQAIKEDPQARIH
ncbi:hypothetical protein QFC22_003249 [Naganishia vaughanmartiniae]|uniref:Uncharacterized protein n=1 Tax=Naganishia vaughanmartiniae TaxID=1424756 RepID=A0ACC2X7H2_9TREE|nr:hypothetical protein QFC22_003249 [Naganishia vaughanmartiniae]